MGNILSERELIDVVERDRASGRSIGLANGCFDLLHVGHVRYLQAAAAEADRLIVAINDDGSVAALKGAGRPILAAADRAELVAALRGVDYVVVFDELTPLELIHDVRPDVLVKGADYRKHEVVGADFVETLGGRVHLAALHDGYSTTRILRQLEAA